MAALGSLLVIGLVWFAKQQAAEQPSVEQPATFTVLPELATFTVLPEPETARVRILNIGSPYRAGMKLAARDHTKWRRVRRATRRKRTR